MAPGLEIHLQSRGIDELYNPHADPQERTNRAADPVYRGMLQTMCRRMWRKMASIGDTSLFNTEYTKLRTAPVGSRAE